MTRFAILCQHEATGRALGAWLELLGGDPLSMAGSSPERLSDPRCIVWSKPAGNEIESPTLAFLDLARCIRTQTSEADGTIPLNEVVVLVDRIRPQLLNPLGEGLHWEGLVAQLILAFPEIHWIFGAVLGSDDGFPVAAHAMPVLLTKPRRDPLFDPTGLRQFVRKKANENLLNDLRLPLRMQKAAAIDEEEGYALFHAFTAYRFGYRADAVRSWALMKDLFTGGGGHNFNLLLEDVNLNFPDKTKGVHLSDFGNERAAFCPRLGYVMSGDASSQEDSEFRVIVLSGHSGTDIANMRINRDYVRQNKRQGSSGFALKPVGGMFDLWAKARLFSRLPPDGHPVEFAWPPVTAGEGERPGGHSAPGKLLLIAQHLIRRAEAMNNGALSLSACIQGAVLATDALELLRFQTPTLALQALSLKHQFEVRAEVAFIGVGHHFELDRRLGELQRDVRAASAFFERRRRRATELDALVSIGTQLVMVFRTAGQFNEEQHCLAKVRAWHRRLQLRQPRGPFDLLGQVALAYAEFLLAGPGRFVAALLFWYTGAYAAWRLPFFHVDAVTAASRALNSFFLASPEVAANGPEFALYAVSSLAGLVHLGILLSYLYSVVARK